MGRAVIKRFHFLIFKDQRLWFRALLYLQMTNLLCLQRRNLLSLQKRNRLCLQKTNLLCLETRNLIVCSLPRHPPDIVDTGGRFAAAPVWTMRWGHLGRLQISCLQTQQVCLLQTQETLQRRFCHWKTLQRRIMPPANPPTPDFATGRPSNAGFCYWQTLQRLVLPLGNPPTLDCATRTRLNAGFGPGKNHSDCFRFGGRGLGHPCESPLGNLCTVRVAPQIWYPDLAFLGPQNWKFGLMVCP